jgi:hypothetical protein
VELRCGSTWQYVTGKSHGARARRAVPARLGSAGVEFRVSCLGARTLTRSIRAYSSIGQSPRLITGLFLVRTQVGPLYDWVAGALARDTSDWVAGALARDTSDWVAGALARDTSFASETCPRTAGALWSRSPQPATRASRLRLSRALRAGGGRCASRAGAEGRRLDSEESRFP